MSPDPTSRRRFLRLAAAGTLAAAGCLNRGTASASSTPTPTSTPTRTPTPTPTPTPEPPSDSNVPWDTGLGRAVEWFARADRWTGDGGTTVALDDGTGTDASPDPFRGDHSLRVEGSGRVQVVGDFSDAPLDLRDRSVSFALDSEDPERTAGMFTVLYAPDYRNSVRFENWYVGRQDLDWVRYDCGVDAVRGDPDLSDVQTVKVRVTAPEGASARFWLDDLRALPRPERGKVMVMFDDLRESQYPNAFPVMEEYDIPAGFATIVDNVGGTVTLDQIHEMERAGSEFVSHSMTGETMTEIDGETRRRYLRESREWLEEHTLNPEAAEHFVFPESKYGSGALADVRDCYEYAYVAGPGSAAGLTDPYTVNRINWDNYSLEEHAELLDRTARHRGLLIAALHDVEGEQVEKFERYCATLDGMRDRVDIVTPTGLAATQADLTPE